MVGHSLDYGVERVVGGGRGFGVPPEHGLRADKEQVEEGLWEDVCELVPDFAGKGGFRSGAEDKEADGGGL